MTHLSLLDLARQGWRARASCSEHDPELFFPDRGGFATAVKRICRACPVRVDCLQHALDSKERFGIWGGATPLERAAMRRAHYRPSRAPGTGPAASPRKGNS